MPGKFDFTVVQGEDCFLTMFWKTQPGECCDGETPTPPAPVDLTGYSLRMQIRPSPGSATLYYEANEANQRLVKVSPEIGQFALYIPAAESSAWAWRRGVYDLEITHVASGIVKRLLEGAVTVSPEVTVDP